MFTASPQLFSGDSIALILIAACVPAIIFKSQHTRHRGEQFSKLMCLLGSESFPPLLSLSLCVRSGKGNKKEVISNNDLPQHFSLYYFGPSFFSS